jgi:hypothetical protein
MCEFCIEHTIRRAKEFKACCEFHIPSLRKYLEQCMIDNEKVKAVRHAREQWAAEFQCEWKR